MNSIILRPNFVPQGRELRRFFEDQYADHKQSHANRFVWDYWYVENQYKLLRTPAYLYFPDKIYQSFHQQLVQWGRQFLGCHDVSPPWLSLYINTCEQKMHADLPHGPWAFVYSLSPRKITYKGGETFVLKDWVLDYWKDFRQQTDRELNSFLEIIPSKFNQLLVFDPRRPHGVTQLNGAEDPRQGRLVIHGWFVNPRPYVEGPLKPEQVEKPIQKGIEQILGLDIHVEKLQGVLSLRLQINSQGEVLKNKILAHTLVGLSKTEINLFLHSVLKIFGKLTFPRSRKPSKNFSYLTIPILFQ